MWQRYYYYVEVHRTTSRLWQNQITRDYGIQNKTDTPRTFSVRLSKGQTKTEYFPTDPPMGWGYDDMVNDRVLTLQYNGTFTGTIGHMEETWTSKFSNETLFENWEAGIYKGNGTRTVDKETCYIVKHNVSEADEVVESLNPITVSKVLNKDGKILSQATARMNMAIRRLYTADVPYTGPSHDNKCFTPTIYTQAPAKNGTYEVKIEHIIDKDGVETVMSTKIGRLDSSNSILTHQINTTAVQPCCNEYFFNNRPYQPIVPRNLTLRIGRKHPWLDDSEEDDVATLQMAKVEKSCKGTKPAVLAEYDGPTYSAIDGHELTTSIYSAFKGFREYCQSSGFYQTIGCISQTVKTDGTPTRVVFGKLGNKFLKRDITDFTSCHSKNFSNDCSDGWLEHFNKEYENKTKSISQDILLITIQRSGTSKNESIISIPVLMSFTYLYSKICQPLK